MSICFYKSEDPFAGRRDQWWYVEAGTTIAEACGGHNVRAWVNGREVSALFIERARLKDGVVIFVEPVPPEASAVLAVAATVAAGAASTAGLTLAGAGFAALPMRLSTTTLL